MEQKTFELIRDLSNAFGPSGFEDEVVKTARTFIEGSVDHLDEDPIRNLFLYRDPGITPLQFITPVHVRTGVIFTALSSSAGAPG